MVHLETRFWTDARTPARETASSTVSVLAYRSRAVTPPTRIELDQILRSAQARNRTAGLTGLLIYDQGCFYQWLEGPRLALMQVWDSIRRDSRHSDFKILRQQSMPERFFKGWDMRLARRSHGEIDTVLTGMTAPQELLTRLRLQPAVLAGGDWDRVFADVVIPRLRLSHAGQRRDRRDLRGRAPGDLPAIWHAKHDAGATLAGVLLAVDSGHTERYFDGLLDEGAGLESLYHEVFEPAARCLGGLWDEDRCDEFSVTLAMCRLQAEARRLSLSLVRNEAAAQVGNSVLVAALPGEPHGLNATLCSELYYRSGWDVNHDIPSSEGILREMLHDQWFDVLDLSLSGALRRDRQLPAMRLTIQAARAVSMNQALTVIVAGRSFFDRPETYLDVGADAACLTSTDAVPAAQQLLDALALRTHAGRRQAVG